MSELKGTTIRTKTVEVEKDYPWKVTITFYSNDVSEEFPILVPGYEPMVKVNETVTLNIPKYSMIRMVYGLYHNITTKNVNRLDEQCSVKYSTRLDLYQVTADNAELIVTD